MPAAAERAPKRGARGPVAAVRQLWRRQADRRVQAGLLCESRRDTALADTESKAATKVNQGHEHGYRVSSFESKNKCTPDSSCTKWVLVHSGVLIYSTNVNVPTYKSII